MANARIVGSFRINTTGNRTTDEVIAAGNYDWKNCWVNGKNFPMRPMPEGAREIVFLEFDHEPTSEEVLAEEAQQGLERPRYEDALFFGEQHPEEQRTAPIVFLHRPQWLRKRLSCVLALTGNGDERGLIWGYPDNQWGRWCRFAFVRK